MCVSDELEALCDGLSVELVHKH